MAPRECSKAPRVAGEGVVALVARVDRWAAQLFPTSVDPGGCDKRLIKDTAAVAARRFAARVPPSSCSCLTQCPSKKNRNEQTVRKQKAPDTYRLETAR